VPVRAQKQTSEMYRFGPFELDVAGRALRKFGVRLKLERKPLQVLTALVSRPAELVSREELQRALWRDEVFVDFEHGLNVAVQKLRASLFDSVDAPTFIETIPGEGYRFIAKVERIFPSAELSLSSAASSVAMRAETVAGEGRRLIAPQRSQTISLADSTPDQGYKLALGQWHGLSRRAVLVAVVLCVCFLVIGSATMFRRPNPEPKSSRERRVMLVVLPFANLSAESSQDYVSDGFTEELSERLGSLNPQQLGVIGRTSAMTYKETSRTVTQIGKDLGVDYAVEGSVRREGSRVRITAQLINVSDQAHVWAHDYDEKIRDLLQTEDEVASAIAEQVQVSIASGRPQNSIPPHVAIPEAHEAYLLGRYYWYKRTPEGWRRAEQSFRDAIKRDPEYAAAYAGLAQCRELRKEEAVAAAQKAVELDPYSAEAQTALGWVEFYKVWDFAAAANALKAAIRLDPNYAPAHHTYAGVLEYYDRLEEAIDQEKQAVVTDPLALIFRSALAEQLSTAGQNDQALEQINKIFEIDPLYPKGHEAMGVIYLRRGLYQEALREFKATEQLGGGKQLAFFGFAYASLGKKKEATKVLSELIELDKTSPSGDVSYDLALLQMGLGNRDSALTWLEKEYQQHDDDGPWTANVDPLFAPLRSDSRFQNLLRRNKYPS